MKKLVTALVTFALLAGPAAANAGWYGGYGHRGYGHRGYGHHGYGHRGYGHHGYGGWEGPAVLGGVLLGAVLFNRLFPPQPPPGWCAPDDAGCRMVRGHEAGAYTGRVRSADDAERDAFGRGFDGAYGRR